METLIHVVANRAGGAFEVNWQQILGRRARQEDGVLVYHRGGATILALSDGMGGHPDGHEASRITLETLEDHIAGGDPASPDEWSDLLHSAVLEAHRAVLAYGRDRETDKRRPGATLAAIGLLPAIGVWFFASVGDSLLYRKSVDGSLERINTLHEDGEGKLTSCIGVGLDRLRAIDGIGQIRRLKDGDVFMLASDGLEGLTLQEIEAQLRGRKTPSAIASALLRAVEAKADPEQDNTTVLVARAAAPAKRG